MQRRASMFEVSNETNWSVGLYPGWGKNRQYQFVLVIKQSFNFDLFGKLTAIDDPAPVQVVDEYYGDPLTTSLKRVNEIAPFKKGGEIILDGTAYPHKKNATVSPVRLEIAGEGVHMKKSLVAVGARSWTKGILGAQVSEPEILSATRLIYENAYGGSCAYDEEDFDVRNPVGMGFVGKKQDPVNVSLPLLEYQEQRVKKPREKLEPASFAPIPMFWAPRESFESDIKEESVRMGECYYGKSIPDNLFNVAPLDQQFKRSFNGNEIITLAGFFKETSDPIRLKLNIEAPEVAVLESIEPDYVTPVLDTFVINTDEMRLDCIWRHAIQHEQVESEISWVYVRDKTNSTSQKQRA